jgi:thiol-disulfide isomerase/thioredoxin
MPLFEEYYNHYSEDFTILAVNYGETETVVRDFVEEYRLTFPVLLDPSDKVNSLYRINGYPTTYFVDAGGKVTNVHVGLLSNGNLKKYMQNLGIEK